MSVDILVSFDVLTCPTCGGVFAMTSKFLNERKEDHATFYCPAGHSQWFPQKTKEDILREDLAKEVSKRIAAEQGICTICKKKVINTTMERHLKKHQKLKVIK